MHVGVCACVSVCAGMCTLYVRMHNHVCVHVCADTSGSRSPISLLHSSPLVNMGELFICSPGHLGYFQLLLLPKNSRGDKHPPPLEQPFPKDHPPAVLSEASGQPLRTILGTCRRYCLTLALRAQGRICGNS